MLILLFGRAIDQGNEVHGFQNGFDQSIVGTINHFQQLRLIGPYRNHQSPANGKLFDQCGRYLRRCRGHQYAIKGGIFWSAGVAVTVAQSDIA